MGQALHGTLGSAKIHSDHLASDNLCDTKEWWLELFK